MNAFHPGSKRRLIAVDYGSRCVKLLLVEVNGLSPAVLDHRIVDLQEEGLIEAGEIQRHLAGILQTWGEWPLAVALPARFSFVQVLDLPEAGEKEIPKVIEQQTGRLREFSSSPLVYDAAPLQPFGKFRQPYLIILAREADVEQHLKRVTAQINEIRDVTGVAGALLGACRALQPAARGGLVVDLGATTTVVAVVCNGQGVYSSSFASGGNAFVEAVAGVRRIPGTEAEALMRAENLLGGAQPMPALRVALDAWMMQLRAVVEDCRRQNPDWLPSGQALPVTISGGVLQSPGLLAALQAQAGFAFARWPMPAGVHDPQFLSDFAVAYGTALEAVRRPQHAPSLLPPSLRAHRLRVQQMASLNTAGVIFLLLVALLLAGATWQKISLLNQKRALNQRAERALTQVQQIENLARERDQAFERVWALLDRQERSLDLLQMLRALQESRAVRDFWCVLLADTDSYARGTTYPVSATNRFGFANLLAVTEETLLKPAFIVELCVPAKGDQTLKVLSEIVADLKKNPLFSRVDSVPVAQRRTLVDAKVLIPDRHFALQAELADLGWRNLLQTVRLAEPRSSTNGLRRPLFLPSPRPRPLPSPQPTDSAPAKPNA